MAINNLSTIDVTNCPLLEELSLRENNLTSLNLSGCPNLKKLDIGKNELPSIDASVCPLLEQLSFDNNHITAQPDTRASIFPSLMLLIIGYTPFTYNPLLISTNVKIFSCEGMNLTTLDLTPFTVLENLTCSYNQLTSLNLTSSEMKNLYCRNNQLTSIDFGPTHKISGLNCRNNLLTNLDFGQQNDISTGDGSFDYANNPPLYSINFKNGKNNGSTFPQFSGVPNLRFICVDDSEASYFINTLATAGLTNCVVNGYCDFAPGGVSYSVNGTVRFDSNGNGCDSSDDIVPRQNIQIETSNYGIADNSGTYNFFLAAGSRTLTPVFENPSYFTVAPPSATFTLSASNAPYTQNFCLSANGVHPDVEVSVFPLSDARPGFNAKYKIVYRNKGNQQASGSVQLNYNDSVMNFSSAAPVQISQTTNVAIWNYTNLKPFESREIEVNFALSAPTSTPPLNGNIDLAYDASITQTLADDTPSDNSFHLIHKTVNSFDPNDKACLQGQTVSTTSIGNYVHYKIRFENTGTANAVNIIVKDVIDATKFEVSSLVPLSGSHEFVTRITGNNVEFIFENINLPFDDANNDGYVAFKIKTKSTLVVGSIFSNTASIYFDYNFPIVTNTATTTITALAKQDFNFLDAFSISPNPAKNTLNIASKSETVISSISIYNALGQLMIVIPNAKGTSTIDVSNLSIGNYFIKINSDKGTANAKFVKN